MPTAQRLLAAAIAIGLLMAAGSASAQKKLYCWTEGGRKVCGDALPAEAANSARTEISPKSGLPTRRVERAMTDEERTAAAIAADLARKQADAEAINKRRDLAMVESYTTEADLLRAYGDRTALVEESIKTSQLSLSNLRLSLLSLLSQAGDSELDNEPVPKRMTDKIQRQHDELLRQQLMLVDQQRDGSTLQKELQDAVRRYRSLKKPEIEAPATGSATTGAKDTATAATPVAR